MIFELIKDKSKNVQFGEVISYVEENYNFSPIAFRNGDMYNEAGQNNGSCKIFQFAIISNLTKEETLACFGDYYSKDVLENLEGNDHQNIRNFMKFGFEGLEFENITLAPKRR
jgi:hypothetical protein